MSKHLLETQFVQLLVEAITSEVPKVQTGIDESMFEKYDQEIVCVLPESLRGIHELRNKLWALGEHLESELMSHPKKSKSCSKNILLVDVIRSQVEALGKIIFSELFRQYPEWSQNCRIGFISEWRVVRLTLKKNSRSQKHESSSRQLH